MYSLVPLLSTVMTLAVIGVILYAIFRPRAKSEQHGKDAYFYIVAFVVLMPLFWGVADMGRLMLQQAWGLGQPSYVYSSVRSSGSYEANLRAISLRMSTIVVALPLFVFHLWKPSSRKREDMDWSSRKAYSLAVLLLATLMVLVTGIWLVYQGFNFALGVPGTDAKEQLAYVLPYATASLAVWGYHMRMWRAVDVKAEPAKVAENSTEEMK